MQEFQPPPTAIDQNMLRRFYLEADQAKLDKSMDADKRELESKGYTLRRRVKIGRNEPCPCNSGRKFKKCCLHKAVTQP